MVMLRSERRGERLLKPSRRLWRELSRSSVGGQEEAQSGLHRLSSPRRISHNVDDDTNEAFPAQEQAHLPVVVNNDAVPEPTRPQSWWKSPQQFPPLSMKSFPNPRLPQTLKQPRIYPSKSSESDVEASTATIAPYFVNPKVGTEAEPTGRSQVQSDTTEIVDTFLLPEKPSPPSPVQQIDSDAEDEVVSLDSDAEGSDWSWTGLRLSTR